MDKPAELAYLLDVYGPLLSARQRQLMEMRVDDDLSFTEIAQNMGISRQGAHDAVTKAARYLDAYESQLGFIRYRLAVQGGIARALDALEKGDAQRAAAILGEAARWDSDRGDSDGV